MSRFKTILFAVFALLVLPLPGFGLTLSLGRGFARPDLPHLVAQADVVCVGRVAAVTRGASVAVDQGMRHLDKPVLIPAYQAVATVTVERLYKGRVPGKSLGAGFLIADRSHLRRGDPRDSFMPDPFDHLRAGERAMFFLKRAGDGKGLTLVDPATFDWGTVPLDPKAELGPTDGLTPLRAAALALARASATSGQKEALNALEHLQTVSFLLYMEKRNAEDKRMADLRSALGETEAGGLEAFVAGSVVPVLLPLTRSADVELGGQALVTAAVLQDVSVLPTVAARARPGERGFVNPYVGAIMGVRNPKAVPALIPMLDSPVADVRPMAAYALWHTGDERAIPALLDHLDVPDREFRHMLINALITLTDAVPPSGGEEDPSWQKEVDFFRQWAAQNKAKVDALRKG